MALEHFAQSQAIALDAITFSQTEAQKMRRRSFDKVKLGELADTIKTQGVLQPVLVRAIKGKGYELVAGERRVLASKLAGLTHVPAMVRELSDVEVVESQLVENLQREDLHPMHEAESFEALLKNRKGNVDEFLPELLAKIGKSRTHFYNRLKLLDLSKKCREAFYDGKVSASVAEKLARIPSQKLQDEALLDVAGLRYSNESPMSYRQAVKHIESRYMLALKDAPFDVKDGALPGGPCGVCPKRTGCNPDLFADVKSADVCTDPDCFAGKVRAVGARQIEEAKAKGVHVITGKAAKAIAQHGADHLQNGFVRVDGSIYRNGYHKVRDLMREDTPVQLLQDPKTGRAVEVVHEDTLRKPKREPDPNSYESKKRADQQRARVERTVRLEIFKAVRPKLKPLTKRQVAQLVAESLSYTDWELYRSAEGVKDHSIDDTASKHVEQLRGDKALDAFLAEAFVLGELDVSAYRTPKLQRLLAAAKAARVDVAAIRREHTPAKKAKKAKKKAVRK